MSVNVGAIRLIYYTSKPFVAPSDEASQKKCWEFVCTQHEAASFKYTLMQKHEAGQARDEMPPDSYYRASTEIIANANTFPVEAYRTKQAADQVMKEARQHTFNLWQNTLVLAAFAHLDAVLQR